MGQEGVDKSRDTAVLANNNDFRFCDTRRLKYRRVRVKRRLLFLSWMASWAERNESEALHSEKAMLDTSVVADTNRCTYF